ncbi:MAG TPA: IS1182 family transposase, partial [bacterium]|nr:IS1182 family transposase [bacterium]
PPYHPAMMVKVLVYGYCTGVYSSRRIARHVLEDVAFRVLAAGNTPDFRTISDFRLRHLKALTGLFEQTLRVARKAGLLKMGHVALDSTKLRANASKHKAMSYGRMKTDEARLAAEVAAMLKQAAATDAEEDRRYGRDVSGDELPAELRRREDRLRKIREAKAALEAEAQHRAATDQGDPPPPGQAPPPAKATPPDKAQYNFTDPQSCIMRNADGAFIQGYNAQVVVDAHHQLIVAADVTAQPADSCHLVPMVQAVRETTRRRPRRLSADAGYYSEANVTATAVRGIDLYVAVRKQRHNRPVEPAPRGRIPQHCSVKDRMDRKLRTKLGRAIYRRRKAIVEPVLGHIKAARGFDRFRLRGLQKVQGEWTLVTLAHNICRLFGARSKVQGVLRPVFG